MTLGSWCDKGLKVGEWVCGWMGWWGYGGSGGMGMFVRESVGVEATLALKVISFFAGKTPNLSCTLRYSLFSSLDLTPSPSFATFYIAFVASLICFLSILFWSHVRITIFAFFKLDEEGS